MQGFTAFNHVRNGVDDGGFDRLIIKDNVVNSSFTHGVAVMACRDCTITGNRASSTPGSKWRTKVNIYDCVRCTVERNIFQSGPARLR
jgi:parallel beta-helix repeat protein